LTALFLYAFLVTYCREAAIKNKNFGLWVAGATHVGALLPRSGNKKQEFWVVGCIGSPR
jgi:hypothetical protein